MKNKNILVTGGSGFIGKAFLNKLQDCSDNVYCLTREKLSSDKFKSVFCDLSKNNSVLKAKETLPDIHRIVHLAAAVPTYSNLNDLRFHYKNNLLSTINLFQFFSKYTESIIFTSTTDVYGNIEILPVKENHSTNPLTYYSAAKLSAEKTLQIFCNRENVNLSILRLSHVFGPGEDTIKFIPTAIDKLINNEEIIINNGGKDTRDYIFINDIVDTILKFLETGLNGVFNIANGAEISIERVISFLLTIHKKEAKIKMLPYSGSHSRIFFDISLIRRSINYIPKISLVEGLEIQYKSASLKNTK